MTHVLPQQYQSPHPAFLARAGTRAPEGGENTIECSQKPRHPITLDGDSFHVCKGYLIPSYLKDASKNETKERLTLAHEVAHRYFRAVERDDDAEIKEGDLQLLRDWYNSLKHPPEEEAPSYPIMENKSRMLRINVGAAYLALLVKRIENLSEKIIIANGDGEHQEEIQQANDELRTHLITLLSDHELLQCPRLSGGKPDLDGIVGEMLSEVGKVAYDRGEGMMPLEELHRNRIVKVGDAMELIDAAHHTIVYDILPESGLPDTDAQRLTSALQEYTDASRRRCGIRRSDRHNYLVANAERKTTREIVKHDLRELDERYKDNPTIHHALDAIEAGRSLIDDMCFYRTPMPKTLDALREKSGLKKWKDKDAPENPTRCVSGGEETCAVHIRAENGPAAGR